MSFQKRFFSFFLPFILFSFCAAQTSLYAPDTIQIIEITFTQPNWDYQLDTAKAGADGYTVASEVKVNGMVFTSPGIKYKGNSSYDSTRLKNPIHIKLDYVNNGVSYMGYEDIKISNGFSDPTSVREVLAYSILGNYMDSPLSNFAKLYINGTYYGVFSNSENIDNRFLENHFYSNDRSFFKCNPENVVNGHIPSLVYLGTDSTLYFDRYELKSDYGWTEMVHFCDTINNQFSFVEEVLDIDRAIWMLAYNNVMVNLDSYTGAFAQNYYLYRDHNNRFIPIMWDLNMCFGGFSNTGTGNLNTASMQLMDPLLHSANASRPLLKKILSDPFYRKMYVAHMRTLNEEFFLNGTYSGMAAIMHSLIDTSVQAESFSLYSYPQFQQGMTSTIGAIPGLSELMDVRANFLDTSALFQQAPPAISNMLTTPSVPAFGASFSITANITNVSSANLRYRFKKSGVFSKTQMYDDGLHGDGASGDNVFGATINANSLDIQFYIYADNANAGMFSPQRAEHEFYSVFPSINQANPGDIVINEYLSNNVNGILNENGKHKDWIEVYNKTSQPLGISNLFLSDDFSNILKWNFPSDAFIPAHDFLLIWADDKNANLLDYHCNFNLSSSNDSLFLYDSILQFFDSTLAFTSTQDLALARCPDGSGTFQTTFVTTPRTSNYCSLIHVDEMISAKNSVTIFPNPVNHELHFIPNPGFQISDISILNALGQDAVLPYDKQVDFVDVSFLPAGIYFVVFKDANGNRINKKFLKN